MAMNVNFLKGLYSKYEGLASKDSNTFYLTYESGTNEAMGGAIRLFLGAEELTNKVDIAALREYIGSLPEGATSEDVVSYISEAITAKIGTLKIGDTSYDTVVDYVIAKTTGVVQGKADKVAPAAVNNIAVLTAEGNLSDGGKTIAEVEQAAKDYTDDEITGLEFELSDDGKTLNLNNKDGTAVATLDTTSFIKDGMIKSVELVDADGDGKAGKFLKITWNIDDANGTDSDSNLDVVYVDVTTLVDVYTGSTTDNKDGINVKVENYNISAELGANVVNDIASGVAAQTTLSSGSVAISANGNTIKVSAFGKNSDAFTVPFATNATYAENAQLADLASDASDAQKLGGKDPSYYEVSGTAATMIGAQQTEETAATGVYAAIQGATTNTVRQCVDAINAMNNQTGVVIGTVENIVTQLTWGSF